MFGRKKNFGSKKNLSPKNIFGPKKKILVKKNFRSKKILRPPKKFCVWKELCAKKFCVPKILGMKKLSILVHKIRSPKSRVQEVGQNQVSPSSYGRMLSGHICCLDQCHYVNLGPRNLPLNFCQNRVSNSWDIPDMNKCCQDKCCLDKCQVDGRNLF